MASAYAEEKLTDEEQKALAEFEGSPPPPDDEQVLTPIEEKPAEAAPEGDKPAAEPEAAKPATDGPDPELAAFLKKHEGKSASELLDLAFNQQKGRARAEFEARQASKGMTDFTARAKAALERAEAVKVDNANKRAAFDERLRDDPDAATRDLHEALLTREEAEAEAAAHTARLEAAYGMASQAIPDAQNAIPAALEFAAEFNYTPEEIANVSDGRDIVMLHLARLAGNLIKGGHMDASGRMLSLPEPVSQKPTDPRLQDRAPLATLGTTAGSASAPSNNVEDELNAILNMSEAEMAKLDPDKLQKLLGAAMGQ